MMQCQDTWFGDDSIGFFNSLLNDSGQEDPLVQAPTSNQGDSLLSPEEAQRLKNRLKQQRSRARRRAAEQSQLQQIDRLTREICQSKHRLQEKFVRTQALRTTNAHLTAELAEVREAVQAAQQSAPASCTVQPQERNACTVDASTPPGHPPACNVRVGVPSGVQTCARATQQAACVATQRTPAATTLSDPESCAAARSGKGIRTASRESSACSIFATEPLFRERKCSRPLSVSHVDTSLPYLAAVSSYRSNIAQDLGCKVDDITWLVESRLYPELTRDGGIDSCTRTSESAARLAALRFATSIETALLLATIERLEQLRDEHPDFTPHVLRPPSAGVGSVCEASDSLPPRNHAPETAWRREDAITSQGAAVCSRDAVSALSGEAPPSGPATDDFPPLDPAHIDMLFGNVLARLSLEAASSSVPPQTNAHGLLQTVHTVFAGLFAKYIPWVSLAVILRVSRRLRRQFGSSQAGGSAAGLASLVLAPGQSFASVLAVLDSVLSAVLEEVQLKPVALKVPGTLWEIQSALETKEKRLMAVEYERGLVFSTTNKDKAAHALAAAQCGNPVALGYVEFEKYSLSAWKMLELSLDQKHSIARLWSAYVRRQRRHVVDFDTAAQRLIAASSVGDLVRDGGRALLELAESIYQHDKVLAAALEEAEDSDAQSPTLELGLFTGQGPLTSGEQRRAGGPCSSSELPQRPDWMQEMLGVSPEATDAAAQLLARLKDVQGRKIDLYLEFICCLQASLTSKQQAILIARPMPFNADLFRIAGMASTDVCCQRVFGRPAICN